MVRKSITWASRNCQSPGKPKAERLDLVSNPKQNAWCQKAEGKTPSEVEERINHQPELKIEKTPPPNNLK